LTDASANSAKPHVGNCQLKTSWTSSAEITERMAAAAEYQRLGRAEQASRLKAEATALRFFLASALQD
jgi:hypothetical protein